MTVTVRETKGQQKFRLLKPENACQSIFFCFLVWASQCTCHENTILRQSVSPYLPWHPESPSFAMLNNSQNIWADYFPCLSTDPIHIDAKIYIVPVRCEFKDV